MKHRATHESQGLGLFSGIILGAAAMYILDPQRGRRRRALLRDKLVLAGNELRDAADVTARDLLHRAQGLASETWSALRPGDADDAVLEQRVRARLGRAVSHPSSIEVRATDGRVTLSGPVLAHELDSLLAEVESVRGVREVEDRCEVHKEPGDVPGLQGGRPRYGTRPDVLQRNWAPATRFLVGAAGATTALWGFSRRDLPGLAAGAFGVGLLARATSNLETRRMLGGGGRRAIDLQKTIHIAAPVDEVYAFWRKMENFPRIMQHVRAVEPAGDGRYRWTVTGPAGTPVSWNAEITEEIPNRVLSWRSEPGALVANAGIVRFDEENGGTRLHVRMSYNPPGGLLGHWVAALFGVDPKQAMDDDLARFKSLIEVGKTGAHGTHVTKDELAG